MGVTLPILILSKDLPMLAGGDPMKWREPVHF